MLNGDEFGKRAVNRAEDGREVAAEVGLQAESAMWRTFMRRLLHGQNRLTLLLSLETTIVVC